MSIHCEVGGVDYSSVIAELDLEPSGPGKIGTGTLHLFQSGSSIVDRQTVKIWRVDAGGHLIRRYFGGYVGGAGTGRLSVTPTKTWDIPLQDYNVANKRLVADVDLITDSGRVVNAGTFAAQIAAAVLAWQTMNGTPSVSIDATSKVVNLTGATVLPAIPGLNGKALGYVLQKICDNARVVTPALRPRWYFGLDDTFGGATVFGPPVLWVYNAADVTATDADLSDLPTGGQGSILVGTFKRTTSSPALVDRRQSVYGTPKAVVTTVDTGAHSTYPFDLAGDGYWGEDALEDRDSTTAAQAQAVLDRNVAATAYPRETVELQSTTWIEPGRTAKITFGGDLLNVAYRVVGVHLNFWKTDDDVPRLTYTLGSIPREVGITDADTLGNPPVVGDHVAPGPPTALAGTSTYDGTTHHATISGTFVAPLDLDYEYTELRYHQRLNAGTYGAWAAVTALLGTPGSTQPYTIPGLAASSPGNTWETEIFPQAYDHNHNGSRFGTALLVTNASTDAPGPPTSLTYTSRYRGEGMSEATVSYTAGTGGGTRAYYQWELAPPVGPVQIYRGKAADTSILFKNLVPGQVYSAVGQAVTAYGDGGAFSSPISITAARLIIPLPDAVPTPDDLDGDKSTTFARDYTPTATGSGTVPTRDITTVFDGLSTWALAVGSSAGSATVSAEARKAVGPSTVLTIRFREGNCGAAQGTLSVLVQPRDKSDAVVGLATTAYSAAPSTVATGTLREVKVTLPSTTTITQVSWSVVYTGNGTNARTVYVSVIQLLPSIGVTDTHLITAAGAGLPILDVGAVQRGEIYGIAGTGSNGTLVINAISVGGNSTLIAKNNTGEFFTQDQTFGTSILSAIGAVMLAPFKVDLSFAAGWAGSVAALIKGHATATADLIQAWRGSTLHWWISATGHMGSAGTAPTVAAGGQIGTGPTVNAVSGTDTAGLITLTTGTACPTGGGRVVIVTFATAYATAPRVFVVPADDPTADLYSSAAVTIYAGVETTTKFEIRTTGSSGFLPDSTAFAWKYWVIQAP